ncbi:LCP family protein [Actinocrinis puniceicyclus]|uniref:LCP family protein n=1 Tax=Actinocrinis puniceicyclus TaxID=977794 RepID=A0A8J8BBK6_9ACTN|nr:LCP family protein [Actinocrinis puniceicyclus]MBS2962181.1 LCP family protein [Actinocrinis puniceicyclus]
MSDDRGWYPAYGADDRGGEGRRREEPGYDPYAQGQGSVRPGQGEGVAYPVNRGGQPRDPRRVPPPPQQRQPQPQDQWSADPYARQGRDGRGPGSGGGSGGGWPPREGWAPGAAGRGAERAAPADAYPSRDPYSGNAAWAPAGAQPQIPSRRGAPGGDGGQDDWVPRSRAGRAGERGDLGRTAVASGAVGIADGNINDDVDLDELDPSGRARRAAAAGRGGGGRRPATGRRKAIKWTAIGVSTLLVAILGIGAYVVLHLTGNIKHTALLQNGATQSPEPTDSYGRSQLNLLVIGSDSRNNPADCAIGHDCGPGANADVEMVVHLSADRSNATVMSIPRDTVVMLPRCTDPVNHTSGGGFVATINSSLQWGPSCTVLAVHQLTGLTIDHFVMVDFVGVESLSNALGGVQVCVTNKMADPNSRLRLNKGINMVQGASALAFVRTRHGFYDGSDLGREKAQHYFLGQMIKEVRATMNLSDFGTLLKVADAATKALTVDDGLSGVTGLEGLATTMNRVPTSRISFVTMPWNVDPASPAHVQVAQPYAEQMFQNIRNDVPYSSGPGAKSSAAASGAPAPSSAPPATSAVAVNKAAVRVQVLNGSGVAGRAGAIRDALSGQGFSLATVGGNAAAASATKVYYPSNRADSAAAVASALGLPNSALKESGAYSEVAVVLGTDWTSGTTFGGAGASGSGSGAGATPTAAASAPAVSSLSNAGDTGNTCIPVNPFYVVK